MTKTIKTIKKQNTKKAVIKKADTQAPKKDFKIILKESGDIKKALKDTKAMRADYKKRLFGADTLATIESLANKYGYSGRAYDIKASFPCKSDIAKIETIRPFTNKSRDTLSPRMVAGLVMAYLLRDTEKGFLRVFPNGLFLENGILKDLLTGGFVKSEKGENEKQAFSFTDKIPDGLFKNKDLLTLEKSLAGADLI